MKFEQPLKCVIYSTNTTKTSPMVNIKYVYVLFAQLSDMLSQCMGLPYQILTMNTRGVLLPNGTWTGAIGMVRRGEADLGVFPFIMSEELSKAVDFSYPYRVDVLTFAIRKSEKESGLSAILHPFNVKVWIVLLTSMIFASVVHYKYLKGRKYLDTLMNVIAVLFHQSIAIRHKTLHENLLILTWIIGMMFITNCYNSLLLSFLTFPPVNSVKDIPALANKVKSGRYETITRDTSPFPPLLLDSGDESSKIIGKSIYKNKKSLANIETFLASPKSNLAFIEMRQLIAFLNEGFFISNDYFFFVLETITIRKNFPYKNKLDSAIHRITASGLHAKHFRDYLFKTKRSTSGKNADTNTLKSLTILDISGALIVLIFGLSVAATAFFFEILSNNKNPSTFLSERNHQQFYS